jgi:hypothetical protein
MNTFTRLFYHTFIIQIDFDRLKKGSETSNAFQSKITDNFKAE